MSSNALQDMYNAAMYPTQPSAGLIGSSQLGTTNATSLNQLLMQSQQGKIVKEPRLSFQIVEISNGYIMHVNGKDIYLKQIDEAGAEILKAWATYVMDK